MKFPYDADFIDELKRAVPGRFRSYDPDTKIWRVSPPYASAAERLFARYFTDVEPPRRDLALPEWCRVLYVLPQAPPEVVNAAYRVLSKKLHPDHGGSAEKMKALNLAVERAREAGAK
jgi:hypothetical protein